MKRSFRTKADLEQISRLDDVIWKARKEIQAIKMTCVHEDYDVDYVETLKFEFTPFRVCVVCKERLPGITDEEKRELFREWHENLSIDFTEEIFNRDKDGFNMPRASEVLET